MDDKTIKQVLEAAIFTADSPIGRDALLGLFDPGVLNKSSLATYLQSLDESYADSGLMLREVASGFRFQVRKELGPWVSRMWQDKPRRYSRALLETLALVAYRQPITRGEIEEVRGVAVSTNIIKTLLERGWARVVGHRDVPGRPALYATTKAFLDYFDLQSLDQLPPLADIRDLDEINRELGLDAAPDEDGTLIRQSDDDQAAAATTLAADIEETSDDDDKALAVQDFTQVDAVLADFDDNFRHHAKQSKSEPPAGEKSVVTTDNRTAGDTQDE